MKTQQEYYTKPIVIVEDNKEFASLLKILLSSAGLESTHFFKAEEFLSVLEQEHDTFGCLLCDVRLQGISGLQLYNIMQQKLIKLPIIFISGHGNIKMAVKTIQDGACHFLTKPINHQETLDTIFSVLRDVGQRNSHLINHKDFKQKISGLTRREKEILLFIAKGIAPKTTAYELGISRNTVEVHRAAIMKKMKVNSVGELISIAATAGFACN